MSRPSLAAVVAAFVLTSAIGVACGDTASVHIRHETTGTIDWSPCGNVECGKLTVPLDHAQPGGRVITLALARLPAAGKRIGVLLTNPGGPGGSGVQLVRDAAGQFPQDIRNAFDIVSWDPRGLGPDQPVQCLDDLDAFYAVDREPQSPAAVAQNVTASRDFVDACRQHSKDLLPHLATVETVRDLDAIRAALGEQQISYLGFSYGTLIGALYADRYPSHLRAMVLDGVVDPARSYRQSAIDQADAFDASLDAFFEHCRNDTSCAFARGGDPAKAYGDLVGLVRSEPVPGKVDGEARMLGPGELDIGVASALYLGADGYDVLASALAQTASGDSTKMLQLSDAYTGRRKGGKYTNETGVFYATSCLDAPSPAKVAGVQRLADEAARSAPHFGATTVWLGLPCTLWPVPAQGEVAAISAPAAPPFLVVGAIHDPATPYPWALSVSKAMRTATLLTVDGTSHTSYARGNSCVDDTVDRYLIDLTVPARGNRCG
jgi:pimeloyl-ACP methyl ester carboxylesterase